MDSNRDLFHPTGGGSHTSPCWPSTCGRCGPTGTHFYRGWEHGQTCPCPLHPGGGSRKLCACAQTSEGDCQVSGRCLHPSAARPQGLGEQGSAASTEPDACLGGAYVTPPGSVSPKSSDDGGTPTVIAKSPYRTQTCPQAGCAWLPPAETTRLCVCVCGGGGLAPQPPGGAPGPGLRASGPHPRDGF